MRFSRLALTLGAVLIFVAGIATGQNIAQSKFAKYKEPAYINKMEWSLVHANLSALQVKAESDGRTAPNIYFDWKADKVKAKVLVNGDFLGSKSANELRGILMGDSIIAFTYVNNRLPEISEDDFEVEFVNYSQKGPASFAEYKNGKLLLH
jgi:hypothetical protein